MYSPRIPIMRSWTLERSATRTTVAVHPGTVVPST
jgi:hypothetical protein